MRGTNSDNIPCTTIQKALDDAGISVNELARRMNWYRPPVPNVDRVRRALGRKPANGSRKKIQQTVTYERALELIVAMGLEPADYGL